MTEKFTQQQLANFLNALRNSTLSEERKQYYADMVRAENGLTEGLRTELQHELEAEIAVLDEAIDELESAPSVHQAVQLTAEEKKEEKLFAELDEKIKKLEQLRYQYEDKLAALDEFYDPLLEEVHSEESRRKLQQEKAAKAHALEEELKHKVKKYEDEVPPDFN